MNRNGLSTERLRENVGNHDLRNVLTRATPVEIYQVLSIPGVHAICTPGDLGLLPVALDACESFTPMSDAEQREAVERSAGVDIFPMPR